MLADHRFELTAMLPAGVAVRAVHPSAVPRQPATRLGVDVFAVPQVEQLAF
jgi:hypothetical protein